MLKLKSLYVQAHSEFLVDQKIVHFRASPLALLIYINNGKYHGVRNTSAISIKAISRIHAFYRTLLGFNLFL